MGFTLYFARFFRLSVFTVMPIYEYKCTECDHALEKLQKISDDPLQDCPACNKPTLQKLISAAGFRLKGGGWYETDFKSGKKKNVVDSKSDSSGASSKTAPKNKTGGSGSCSSC